MFQSYSSHKLRLFLGSPKFNFSGMLESMTALVKPRASWAFEIKLCSI